MKDAAILELGVLDYILVIWFLIYITLKMLAKNQQARMFRTYSGEKKSSEFMHNSEMGLQSDDWPLFLGILVSLMAFRKAVVSQDLAAIEREFQALGKRVGCLQPLKKKKDTAG